MTDMPVTDEPEQVETDEQRMERIQREVDIQLAIQGDPTSLVGAAEPREDDPNAQQE